MSMRYFYVKTRDGLGLDKHGRATDNIRTWHLYTERAEAQQVAFLYGYFVGCLR